MKKNLLLTLLGAVSVCQSFAQAAPTTTVQDSIAADTHWTNDKQYLLKGYVYVTAGHTLTIDSGCIIKGDKDTKGSLIVERGAKIYANGTKTAPIVFTSNQPAGSRTYGDWGGVILCGKAPVNWNGGQSQVEGGPRSLYGGTDAHDNTGRMTYVRIEFPGVAFSPNNEINGLTLCGLGDATQIDHIQVSYSGDDGFEFFGGRVNTKYMVAYRSWDDDFDTDNGYQGKNQFGFVVRDPYAADNSGSKAFESDSYQTGTATGLGGDTTQLTRPVFSNFTVIGPLVNPTSTAYDPQFIAGAHIRRGSAISILNSVFAGWPCGVLIDESSSAYGSTAANIGNDALQFRNNIISGTSSISTPNPKDVVYVINGARSLTATTAFADTTTGTPFNPFAGPISWLFNPAFSNTVYATEQTGVRLQSPFNLALPNPVPTSTSPICYNGKALPSYMTTGGVDPFHNGKVYPFNPTKPINTDTSGLFAHYNAPNVSPDFTNSKANDAFFTKVNHVGGFSGTQTTSDNWMNGWCNFDPVNTDYSHVNTTEVARVAQSTLQTAIFPNPAKQIAYLSMSLNQNSNLHVIMVDITGKMIKEIFKGEMKSGSTTLNIDLSDVQSGMYFVSVTANNMQKTLKLSVIK